MYVWRAPGAGHDDLQETVVGERNAALAPGMQLKIHKDWLHQEAVCMLTSVPVHSFETPICAYAAMGIGPI